MRHANARYQLNRFTSWRKATLKSLAASVLTYQSIKTTRTKAKAVRPLVEKLISLAKKGTLSAKRQAYAVLGNHKLVSALFNEIAVQFKDRGSGFTRILNLNQRRGDNAQMVILELTQIKKKDLPRKDKKPQESKTEEIVTGLPESIEKPAEGKKHRPDVVVKEKPPLSGKKPFKKLFGGFKNIFRKERDYL